MVDGCGLHHCDLMPTERFADDIESTGQRRVAEGAFHCARRRGSNRGGERLSGLTSSAWAFANAEASAATDSLDRCTACLRF
jgi:hypothetical protein